jgi:hypothetical protein
VIYRNLLMGFVIGLFFISTTQAKLPDINKNDLISAIQFVDSLQTNVDCSYIVDEAFNQSIHGGKMPEKRSLEIQWKQEEIKNYYDVMVNDGQLIRGKPFRYVTTFNGEKRMQFMPNENKGDVFKEPYKPSWPIPIDFGLTLGKHDKKLGESLEECNIKTIKNTHWDGHECYYIEAIQPNGAKAEVWIDPETGWRARNVKLYRSDGLIMYEATADFNDLGNGIFFPINGTAKLYGEDPNTGKRVVSCVRKLNIKEVKVNADLTQQDFEIKFPQDTEVYDHIYGIGFVVGITSLSGIEDTALNDIVKTAKTEKTLSVENAVDIKDKTVSTTTKGKATNSSEPAKTNNEPKITSKDNSIGLVKNMVKFRLWWLIAFLVVGISYPIFTFLRGKNV